ncbi:MAG: hypothetical protein GX605_08845 [Chloroflexi bacterium]|nr:hypothetical protein [Chloroflexota bacterium]
MATMPDKQSDSKSQRRAKASTEPPRQRSAVMLALLALLLFTAVGSLYVSVAGQRARIELQRTRLERQRWDLITEISSLQGEIAPKETYRFVREATVARGMVETRVEDCRYFTLPTEAATVDAGGAQSEPPATQ